MPSTLTSPPGDASTTLRLPSAPMTAALPPTGLDATTPRITLAPPTLPRRIPGAAITPPADAMLLPVRDDVRIEPVEALIYHEVAARHPLPAPAAERGWFTTTTEPAAR